MVSTNSSSKGSFWHEDPFGIIHSKDFEVLGIDPSDIPQGTSAAHRHPPLLLSRFGGNAYGFGFFEMYEHLDAEDIKLLQSISFDNPDRIKRHYRKINNIYKNIGLLIRFSRLGKPYYLIPKHLLSISITKIKSKADEISKIINYHSRKYLKEGQKIGVLTHAADPIINDLTLRFKEHQFVIIDSPKKFNSIKEPLDLVVLTRDIYRTILLEKIGRVSGDVLTKKQLEEHAVYMLGKVCKILKPEGEIFIIANRRQLKTIRTTTIKFKTVQEERNFLVFTHVFRTRKRYRIENKSLKINVYDLENYLGLLYVEPDVIERLSGGKDIEKMSLKEISGLPYLDLPLDNEYLYDQQKVWPKLISIYFDKIFHKPLIPSSVKGERDNRLIIKGYSPDYMLIYLAQKKPIDPMVARIKNDVIESSLAGCPLSLLADYRDSFDYLIRTLNVLNIIKNKSYKGLPEVFMERLKEPFKNKRRRYGGLNDVMRLMTKTAKLERIQSYLNPDMIEGSQTRVLENLEALSFFGFDYGELKEICLIIIGHTTGGRILSGKMNEKTLKPVSDLAKTLDPQEALNLLRYCRLMSMAETVASRRTEMNQVQLVELFDLFDSTLKVVRDTDWDSLLDEKVSSIGGIHNKLIHKLLMMMNNFDFLHNWFDLSSKGEMEKESLADYDVKKLAQINNIVNLIKNIDQFEKKLFKNDPLKLPVIYRKLLDMEFHGTGHIFARMDSNLIFTLLWVAVNVTRGGVLNFNPILSDVKYYGIDSRVKKVEGEARAINMDYLSPDTLKYLSEQLYENKSAFIVNTGFRLAINPETNAVDVSYIDMNENIEKLEDLAKRVSGCKISDIPTEDLEEMQKIFANLEDFYRSHQRLLSTSKKSGFKIPERQKRWSRKVIDLRQYLISNFINAIFKPDDIYADLDRLFRHSPAILELALPEFTALRNLSLSGNIYLRSPIIDNILVSTKKIQALIRGNLKDFQDIRTLHRLAQREFGPMAAGIVGFNDSQLETLASIVKDLRKNPSLFNALIKAFIFQDLGLTPSLREKYRDEINTADQAQAGALFAEKEKLPQRYGMGKGSEKTLIFLIKYHDRIHHLVRGEFSLHALREIIDNKDKDLFDAFFISSLVMFSALGEGLILEDLASGLFETRKLCHRIIEGKTSLEDFSSLQYAQKGRLYYMLEDFHRGGIPQGKTPSEFFESWTPDEAGDMDFYKAGEMIDSTERIFRLRGLRYVDFSDLVKLIIKVPLGFIYRKRDYRGIGYATFEKDLFEALRIYNSIQGLPEDIRHFILDQLIADKIRIFGFENVSIYLNYENMTKILLIVLLGSKRFKKTEGPICLSFLEMVKDIDKRYESVNDALGKVTVGEIWGDDRYVKRLFRAKTGMLLDKDESKKVLTIAFADKINPSRKISYMKRIKDVEHLKDYYHNSLQSLRKSSFYTDDYELQLEEAFDNRLNVITEMVLNNAKIRMERLKDFKDLHKYYTDLMDRSLEIGFSKDRKHQLNDLYDLRKDTLRREKLEEINLQLENIHEINELKEYWDSVKQYLLDNRQFLGKESENIIARNFDKAVQKIKDMSFQIHFIT